jgi:glutamate synthase (NADPH) large chain
MTFVRRTVKPERCLGNRPLSCSQLPLVMSDDLAAGMCGRLTYVCEPQGLLPERINPDVVIYRPVEVAHYTGQLKSLIVEPHAATQSPLAKRILREFDRERANFRQVVPK